MAKNLNYLQGADALVFVRPLSEAGNKPGALIPYQTGANFEPSRSSKSKETKSGSLPTLASVETDFEVDFIDSTDATSDEIYDSIMNATTLEVWLVQRGRRNAEGKYYAWYMRAMPSKDTSDNDADSQSTRKVKMTVQGTPQRGWTALPDEAQEEIKQAIDYYRENAKVIADTMDAKGIWYTGGKHSPYIWLKCPNGMDSWEFFDKLLNEIQVVGTPGAGFGKNGKNLFFLN